MNICICLFWGHLLSLVLGLQNFRSIQMGGIRGTSGGILSQHGNAGIFLDWWCAYLWYYQNYKSLFTNIQVIYQLLTTEFGQKNSTDRQENGVIHEKSDSVQEVQLPQFEDLDDDDQLTETLVESRSISVLYLLRDQARKSLLKSTKISINL